MRLFSYRGEQGIGVGVLHADRCHGLDDWVARLPLGEEAHGWLRELDLQAPSRGMQRLLYAGPAGMRALRAALSGAAGLPQLPYDIARVAPVPRPGKIVAVGRNYGAHAAETGYAGGGSPRIIGKFPSSVAGPGAVVRRPPGVRKLDLEAELGVVMGRFARNVAAGRALEYVAGYVVLNDLSAREYQFDCSPPQTTFAKSMDGFTPMGPWLVTADEVPQPQALEIRAWVNGLCVQADSTASMLFPVHELIAYVSSFMTLEPGDVIATGTPAGSGAFRHPPRYLQPGDRVRIEIAGLGTLEHSIA